MPRIIHQNRDGHAKTPGYVYILENPAMPGLIKIGMTTKSVEERVAALSRSTSIASPFSIYYSRLVRDCYAVEQDLHKHFKSFRHNKSKEYFYIHPEEVKDELEAYPELPKEILSQKRERKYQEMKNREEAAQAKIRAIQEEKSKRAEILAKQALAIKKALNVFPDVDPVIIRVYGGDPETIKQYIQRQERRSKEIDYLMRPFYELVKPGDKERFIRYAYRDEMIIDALSERRKKASNQTIRKSKPRQSFWSSLFA